MARNVVNRKLEQFTLHAHITRKPPKYVAVFRALAKLPPQERQLVTNERLTAIPRLAIAGEIVRIVALEGPVGLNPLVYNLEDQSERLQTLRSGEVVVSRTHAIIDLKTRNAVVEFNMRGAKAREIAAAVLQQAARRHTQFSNLELSLLPVVGEDFAAALDEFERIRTATLRLRRPNFDWSDVADDLTEAAKRSQAQAANVEFTAGRGDSLDPKGGVVALLRRIAGGRGPSVVEGATVVGHRSADAGETQISLRGHTRHRRASLRRAPDGQADEEDAFEALLEFEKELGTQADATGS